MTWQLLWVYVEEGSVTFGRVVEEVTRTVLHWALLITVLNSTGWGRPLSPLGFGERGS